MAVPDATPRARIAHLGAPGSFSAAAAHLYAERAGLRAELLGHASFAAVLAALAAGAADLAVLPLANSIAGPVEAALAALEAHSLERVDGLELAVSLALLAPPGTALADVARVASHPLAHRQCARSLARLLPGRETLAWSDSASAARDVAAGVLPPGSAALASAEAGALHGLVALARDVQDEPDDRTFFGVFRRAARSRVE